MHDRRLIELLVIAGWVVFSMKLLSSSLPGNWIPLLACGALLAGVLMVVRARHPAYLAFGILVPLGLTLPVIRQVPILGLVLAVSVTGAVVQHMVRGPSRQGVHSWDTLTIVFHLCVLVIYALHPVLPGFALGLSQDITGFRSWLDHAMDLVMLLFLGRLVTCRDDVQGLFRWLRIWAVIFTAIFVVLMFIPGWQLSQTLANAGVFVTFFGNGWRRFVFLPTMGMLMIMAGLMPKLFGVSRFQIRLLVPLGVLAVVAGGNRGSVLGLLMQLAVISLRKGKYLAIASLCLGVSILVIAANALFERGALTVENPLIRVMTTFSPGLAEASGSMGTVEWRLIRWRRAMEDIRLHPWTGMGYGGMKDYFAVVSGERGPSAEMAVERDLATGSTHNGYISAARALGVPITALFMIIMLRRVHRHWRAAGALLQRDPLLGEANLFVCSYLATALAILMVGAEIRAPAFWFFIAVGFVVERLTPVDREAGDPNGPQA